MQTQNPLRMRDDGRRVGGEELAESLMLVRASTLKMIRLQLAMERNDRRVALAEVDDLLALDRRLQDYIAEVPASDEQLLFRRELEAERSSVNHEKLTLCAEVVRRAEPPSEPDPPGFELEGPGPASWGTFEFAEADRHRRRRAIGWFALLLLLLSAAAATAWLLDRPDAWQALMAMMGGVR